VSPIGQGDGGGVETTILQLAPALAMRGHTVAVVAPAGSLVPTHVRVYQVNGHAPLSATTAQRDSQVVTTGYGVVEAMWDCAAEVQRDFDVIVGMTYDWLSFFLTPWFRTPVLHWITVSSTIDIVDKIICQRFANKPELLAFYSAAQARTFHFLSSSRPNVLLGSVDTKQFSFCPSPENRLSWAARISPEKGLEDAVEVATRAGLPLDICGKIQDRDYWNSVISRFPEASFVYHGLLPHSELSAVLGNSIAMLATPKWTEAFGLSMVEALACGTPVLAYARGGPNEIVEHGKSGFLVAPDDTDALLSAVSEVRALNRPDARARAEDFAVDALVLRFEQWVGSALGNATSLRA
jgi:UDP-glucose:tetrahydrobiopterin glucosyltransferase